MTKLDRDILLQTLAGYAEVNRITETERMARLRAMSDAEARRIFAALYQTWKLSGRQAGGDLAALAQQRLEHHLRARAAFAALARRKGLI